MEQGDCTSEAVRFEPGAQEEGGCHTPGFLSL